MHKKKSNYQTLIYSHIYSNTLREKTSIYIYIYIQEHIKKQNRDSQTSVERQNPHISNIYRHEQTKQTNYLHQAT